MKYYFTNSCYWDSKTKTVVRDDLIVPMTGSQTRILAELLNSNGEFVSHDRLHYAMTGGKPKNGDWLASLSNKFTRKKASEKGIFMLVPEIEQFWDHSKSSGYRITVPKENIVDDSDSQLDVWAQLQDVWHSSSYWANQKGRARAAEKEWLVKEVRRYLQGGSCSWPLIFASAQYTPVKRDIVNELKNIVESENGVTVLSGAGGEGKTTILMQLCAELYLAGTTAVYHIPSSRGYDKYDIPDNVATCVYVVDAPANTTAFKRFLSKAVKEGLTVVVAIRSNEWAIIKDSLFDDISRSIREIEMPKISRSEAKSFAGYIKNHIYWVRRSALELEKLFFKDSYGFLYASMLMAIYNADSLEKIAKEIVEKISEFENGEITLKILAAIVFAEQAGTGIGTRTYRTLCRRFDIDDKSAKFYLRKEVVLNGTSYQTRHESISQLFFKYLFANEEDDFLYEEEQEEVIIAILDEYWKKIAESAKDYKPTDISVIELSSLFVKAFSVIDYPETQNFLKQRLLESCKQHGLAAIGRVYHHLDSDAVKTDLALECFDRKLPLWEVYRHWLKNKASEVESVDTVIEHVKTLCLEMDAPENIWNLWTDLLEQNHQHSVTTIEEIREIYKLGVKKLSNNGHWWIAWASFEERHGNLGDVNTEYSVRWLLREGCNCAPENPHLWVKWADVEVECGNLGDPETKYSARWVAKEGCAKVRNTHLWIKRAELEERAGNIGYIETEDCARGILYMGCRVFHQSTHLWIKWAELEVRMGNIGDYETPNSAAWIFKEACTNHGIISDAAIWMKWADFAANYNDSMQCSNGTEFTPSMILRCACVDHRVPNSQVWAKWAEIEERCANIGHYDILYCAAWIYREACMRAIDEHEQIWLQWAYFIESHKELANLHDNTNVILKNKCLLGTNSISPWLAWAIIEEVKGNIGDYSTEYSAAWLYCEVCTNQTFARDYNDNNFIKWVRWAKFAQAYPIRNDDKKLVSIEYVLECAQKLYSGGPEYELEYIQKIKSAVSDEF